MSRRNRRYTVSANLFGIPLGLCGLAQCWTTSGNLDITPRWPADVLWVTAAAAWVVVASAYFGRYHRPTDLARQLADPKFGPFVPVSMLVPVLLASVLARPAPLAGHILFWAALVVTLLLGGWLFGQWMTSATPLAQWHPGYFLPTVGGGLITAIVAVGMGERFLGQLLFGYGVVSWIVLGPIIRLRLFTQPALPIALRSTLAIEIAPPVIAGTAWFQLNGGQVDMVACIFAGYALLMAVVQVRLFPLYRRIPFGPPWWAFSFPYAAVVGYGLQWLAAEHVAGMATWTWLVLIIVTSAAVALLVRTGEALAAHRFLPISVEPSLRLDSNVNQQPAHAFG